MAKPSDFFRELKRQIPKIEKEVAAKIIKVEANNFHADNFRREGFTDRTFKAWKKRKKEPDPPRSLLVKTSATKRIATLLGRVSLGKVKWTFPAEYMKVHNEGTDKMPQRQFVGESEKLKKAIQAKAKRYLDNKLNNL